MEAVGEIAVCGVTGRQGGSVARRLLASGYAVRGLTRRPEGAEARALKALGVRVVAADLSAPHTLRRAFAGADAVFGVTDFWEHGLRGEVRQGGHLIAAAHDAGVRRLVFSSVGGVDRTEGEGIQLIESKRQIEQRLRDSGMAWSVLRPVTFFENFVSERYRKDICRGVFRFAIEPDKPFQLVAMQDLAFFAQMALEGHPFLAERVVEIASDRLTMRELAKAFGDAIGRPVRYRQLHRPALWALAAYVEVTRSRKHYKTGWDLTRLFRWMNGSPTGGWDADIEALRQHHPGLLSASQWASRIAWWGGVPLARPQPG